ncbi:MAG: response regulator, partial [Desulfovibrionales bacterium]|nr:response regulator [Desulfovibrionales bacterium]
MPIITVFSVPYCNEEKVVKNLSEKMGLELVTDKQIISTASSTYGIPEDKFYKALFDKRSVFNAFTRDKERCVACYKAALASIFLKQDLVFQGFGGFLVPKSLTHVLKVCLMAEMDYRLEIASKQHSLSIEGLKKLIAQEDSSRYRWTEYVVHQGPWESSLYDILISMEKISVEEAVELARNFAKKAVTLPTRDSIQAAEDFAFNADIEAELALKGWFVRAKIKDDKLFVRLDKNIMRPERLEDELASILSNVAENMDFEIHSGPDMFQTDVYRPYDSETPAKVLLVDNEKRFAKSLSERLQMQEMGTAAVYNGEEALELIDEDEPEVVILDLKLPGIDGVEVLHYIKRNHPDLPVIILSGGGQEKEFETCTRMGAFACLRKPVEIKDLTETIRQAHLS